jgi:predicted transcriptional regulator
MTKRTKLEIINDLLVAIQEKGGQIKPTHLMYRANLSNKLLHEYLDELSDKGMLERVTTSSTIIKITDKGYEFITQFKKMREFQAAFGL